MQGNLLALQGAYHSAVTSIHNYQDNPIAEYVLTLNYSVSEMFVTSAPVLFV